MRVKLVFFLNKLFLIGLRTQLDVAIARPTSILVTCASQSRTMMDINVRATL